MLNNSDYCPATMEAVQGATGGGRLGLYLAIGSPIPLKIPLRDVAVGGQPWNSVDFNSTQIGWSPAAIR